MDLGKKQTKRTKILHVTVNDCYQTASTWWRATKEASCIIGNAVSGMQREAQAQSSSPPLWTHAHTGTQSKLDVSSATIFPLASQWEWFYESVQ